ncbi:DUF6517 family protein [Halohasta salina]|uniref:DUF6517 family protein n=1 Tax=Halohasta salina TaxID=2961621 RepID=UPI0020A43EEC|nr:DUF6517 family protein [Halohasta salina]
MHRRRVLALLGGIGTVGMAGCLGEDGNFEFTAAPAAIPTAAEAGYEAEGPDAMGINETVEVGGVERDVDIETWSVAYNNPESQSSIFLFSTPDVSFAGVSANPLARLSGADLIVRVLEEGLGQSQGDAAIEELEQEDELTLSVLGEERSAPVFSAVLDTGTDGGAGSQQSGGSGFDAAQNGEIPIRLYLLSFTHSAGESDDVLLSIGLHPQAVEAEAEMVSQLEAIDHPVEAPESESAI